jgi:uncharacterized membrane protein
VLTLAVAEGKRLLLNPALLAGAALGVALAILPWLNGEPKQTWLAENYEQLTLYWAPLFFGAFLAANLAALRERETTTAELFRASPVGYCERTLALLGAVLVPTVLSAVLVWVQLSVISDAGGITVHRTRLTPSVIEMALVPTITAISFISGVAVARTIRSRTVGAVGGAFATFLLFYMYWLLNWLPAYFLHPYSTALRTVDLGTSLAAGERQQWDPIPPDEWHPNWWAIERDVSLVGWHILYLAGVALLTSAYAVRRSGRDRRVRWMLVAGAVLTILGMTMQIAAFGLPLTMGQGVIP